MLPSPGTPSPTSIVASPPSNCTRRAAACLAAARTARQHRTAPVDPPSCRSTSSGSSPAYPSVRCRQPHLPPPTGCRPQAFREEHPGLLEAIAASTAAIEPAAAAPLLRRLEAELPPALHDVGPTGDSVLVAIAPGLAPLLGEPPGRRPQHRLACIASRASQLGPAPLAALASGFAVVTSPCPPAPLPCSPRGRLLRLVPAAGRPAGGGGHRPRRALPPLPPPLWQRPLRGALLRRGHALQAGAACGLHRRRRGHRGGGSGLLALCCHQAMASRGDGQRLPSTPPPGNRPSGGSAWCAELSSPSPDH